MPREGAPASHFSVDGELEMGFFAAGEDNYHTRINGERLETLVARMMGFPSEAEFQQAMNAGVSPDPGQPDVTRRIPRVHFSMHISDEDGMIL